MPLRRTTPCGAKKRDGGACQQPAMRNGRCRLHGGKSLSGIVHPSFRHGQYSGCHLARYIGAVQVLRETGCSVETEEEHTRVFRLTIKTPSAVKSRARRSKEKTDREKTDQAHVPAAGPLR